MLLNKAWTGSSKTIWCLVTLVVTWAVTEVAALSGPNVCMVQQKYNITKRVKYRAPMSIRTYEWCFSMPPRCSKWSTEMRDLTRLETEVRTAEVAVCCPGYKMREVSCVPICPNGKTGHGCTQDCPPNKWGPNCVNNCSECFNGECSPTTGECDCDDGWQGESCQISMITDPAPPALMEKLLTTTKSSIKIFPTTLSTTPTISVAITEITTTIPTTPPTTTIITLPTTNLSKTTTKQTETTFLTTTVLFEKATTIPVNANVTTLSTTMKIESMTTDDPKITVANFIYNRTETPIEGTSTILSTEHESSTIMKTPITTKSPVTALRSNVTTIPSTTVSSNVITTSTTTIPTSTTDSGTVLPKVTVTLPTQNITTKTDFIKERENVSNSKNYPTTIKLKPKEIWIRPTQKGEPTLVENKVKNNHELLNTKLKSATNKNEVTSENTTPRTIIVSIIPTSVSHATFKKIALTTASYLSKKTNVSLIFHNKTDQGFTKSMASQVSTVTPFTIKVLSTINAKNFTKIIENFAQNNITRKSLPPISKKMFKNSTASDKQSHITKAIANTTMATTNSMLSTINGVVKKLNSSTSITVKLPTNKQSIHKNISHEITTASSELKKNKQLIKDDKAFKTRDALNNTNGIKELPKLKIQEKSVKFVTDYSEQVNLTKANVAKEYNSTKITTQGPPEDETFHILTEPEHITAVMSDRDKDHTSMDLISVISIAGGVMMAVITVAVIIVMIERCKRPRYVDVRKINDVRMQVMMDNHDVPPPYVRSIFHTPLPDPPYSNKCHYQPISTLDRNLKQFMRPVVVQTISPVMLENFREILECHYDHLPRRNHDFGTMPTRCLVSPSMRCDEELLRHRPLSAADYTIEALKCEAKLDVIDNTTSEPLYAEIPCWRPPSEHAIGVLNLNGEAVTEL